MSLFWGTKPGSNPLRGWLFTLLPLWVCAVCCVVATARMPTARRCDMRRPLSGPAKRDGRPRKRGRASRCLLVKIPRLCSNCTTLLKDLALNPVRRGRPLSMMVIRELRITRRRFPYGIWHTSGIDIQYRALESGQPSVLQLACSVIRRCRQPCLPSCVCIDCRHERDL